MAWLELKFAVQRATLTSVMSSKMDQPPPDSDIALIQLLYNLTRRVTKGLLQCYIRRD